MNRRIVFLTLIALMAVGLLLSACATDDAPGPQGDVGTQGPLGPQGALGPQGDVGPKGPLGPHFAAEATSVGTSVAAIGLGLALGVLGSVVIIRARKSAQSVANSR